MPEYFETPPTVPPVCRVRWIEVRAPSATMIDAKRPTWLGCAGGACRAGGPSGGLSAPADDPTTLPAHPRPRRHHARSRPHGRTLGGGADGRHAHFGNTRPARPRAGRPSTPHALRRAEPDRTARHEPAGAVRGIAV